jgi:hypothetical protein
MGAADRLPTVCPVVSVVALGLLGDDGHQRAMAPPGTIVVVEAGCGLGEAYGRGLVGVPWAPAAGPTRPAHPYSAGARHARGDRDADCRCGVQRLQPTKMTCKLYPLNAGCAWALRLSAARGRWSAEHVWCICPPNLHVFRMISTFVARMSQMAWDACAKVLW